MQANTAATRKLIFNSEGRYTVDNGGPTMYGVTLTTLRAWRADPSLTAADVKMLTADEAWSIFANKYLRTVRFDDLPSGVDYAMADFSVNSGPAQAIKTMQRVVGVARDGIMGIDTLTAIRRFEPAQLIDLYLDARLAFMQGLSVWSTYGNGWANRIVSVRANAKKLAAIPATAAPVEPVPSKPVVNRASPIGTKLSATPHGKSNIIAGAGTLITAGASAAPDVVQWAGTQRDKLTPFADHFPKLQTVINVLFTIGMVATIIGIAAGVYVTIKQRKQGVPV